MSGLQRRFTIAALAVLVAVVGGGVFVLNKGERPDASPDDTAHGRSAARDETSALPAAVAADDRMAPLAAQRTDALAVEWNDATGDVVGPVVEGTIVATDRDGGKHDEESGSFVPDFIDGEDADVEDGARHRVAVKHGRFRFDARGATVMLVKELVLGGRVAVVDGGVNLASDAPDAPDAPLGAITITARWIDDVLLHVVDAATERELANVTVARGVASVMAEHPGLLYPVDVVVDHERSPFHLQRVTSIDMALLAGPVWVGASGHVWKRITPDFKHGTEGTVSLARAGSLVVAVKEPAGAEPSGPNDLRRLTDRWPRLRLRRPGADATGALVLDLRVELGEVRIDGIEPGDRIASIEVGDPEPRPLVLCTAPVTIEAGATARATLVVDPSAAPRRIVLSGSLFLPASWGDAEMQLVAEPVDLRGGTRSDLRIQGEIDADRRSRRRSGHTFTLGPILPGIYDLFVARAGFETRIEVGEIARHDLVLSLPEPALLKVEVVDEETQAPVDVDHLAWVPADGIPRRLDRLLDRTRRMPRFDGFETELALDPASHAYLGAVAAGRGRITGSSLFTAPSGADVSEQTYDVVAGDNDVVVRVRSPCGVDLEVVSDGKQPGLIDFEWKQLGSVGAPLRGHLEIFGNAKPRRIRLPGPGRYRFTLLDSNEDATDRTFDVDVPHREFVKKRVELDR